MRDELVGRWRAVRSGASLQQLTPGENLVMTAPVDAVPAQGGSETKVDDLCEQIIAVGEERLILDARPFGGDCVTIFERVT